MAGDVFAFDVPVNHTINVVLTMDTDTDFDLRLHQPNGSLIDFSLSIGDGDEFVTSQDSSFENQQGTYFVNITHFPAMEIILSMCTLITAYQFLTLL